MQKTKNRLVLFALTLVLCASLAAPAKAEAGTQAGSVIIAEVTTAKGPLKLRKEPSKNAKVLKELERGSYVTVLSQGEEWFEVDDGHTQGYAMAQFLTICEDVSADILAYRTLQNGDHGDDVLALKQRLMELGYYKSGSKMTNRYNDTVVQRIKMFQRQNGLAEDGVSTPQVQCLLFSQAAAANTEPLPVAPSHYQKTDGKAEDSTGGNADAGWVKEICSCCNGKGCTCCDGTGWIWAPAGA